MRVAWTKEVVVELMQVVQVCILMVEARWLAIRLDIRCGKKRKRAMTLRFWSKGIKLPLTEVGMTLRRKLGDR